MVFHTARTQPGQFPSRLFERVVSSEIMWPGQDY